MGGFAGCFNGKVLPDDSSQESVTLGVVFEATPGFVLSVEVSGKVPRLLLDVCGVHAYAEKAATIVGVFGLKKSGIFEMSLICGGE